MGSHLNRPIYPPEEKFVWFQTPIQTRGVRDANVPWMIYIFWSDAKSPHSLGTRTQLLEARSNTELIARRVGLPFCYTRSEKSFIPFLLTSPCHHPMSIFED